MKKNLKGLTLKELQAFAESLGEKKFRAAQVYDWLYAKRVGTFGEMNNLSKEFRSLLEQAAEIYNLELVTSSLSGDGTEKFLFRLRDGNAIETVLIAPDPTSPTAETRLTLCVSSQVGCALDCKFCATGRMGFKRNLEVGEIVDQIIQVQGRRDRRLTNIVFMGMGEPMLNYDNVMMAIDLLSDDKSMNIGRRHITVSTAGYADRIRQMADEDRRAKLALSLHTMNNDKRALIMPISKKYSVDELMDALDHYYLKTRQRPTFEYILFKGFNDSLEDIRALVRVSRRIPCKINIIPFHSIDFMGLTTIGASLQPAPQEKIEWFANELRNADLTVMVRSSSGKDINAACGQLAVKSGGLLT
jgi:23S rRNA (adenine2503-C2)-methyltransferase